MADQKEKRPDGGASENNIAATLDDSQNATILSTSQDSDRISVLTTRNLRMAKYWKPDGTIEDYSKAKNFHHRFVSIGGIRALSTLLSSLESDPNSCVVRGGYIGDELAEPIMTKDERWEPGYMLRQKETLKDRRLHMLMLDVDEFKPTSADPINNPVEAIDEFICSNLPDVFAGASYHWQLSNSAGSNKNSGLLKVHLWFWLEVAYTCAELKSWAIANTLPIDDSLFESNQIHYTSAPVFARGVINPVPVRSGFVPGWMSDNVPLVIAPNILIPDTSVRKEEAASAFSKDPVAAVLYERGMVRNVQPDGDLNVACPREDHHSSGETKGTACIYKPPRGDYKSGTFVCQHNHCREAPQRLFREALGISEALNINVADGFSDVQDGEDPATQSDVKIARLLAALLHKLGFVFEHGGRGWMIYRTGQYRPCGLGEAVEAAKGLGVEIVKSASGDHESIKRTMALAQRAMSAAGIKSALQLAESDPRLAVEPATFDSDPDFFNVLNGVVHLPTGELHPHDPAQFFSRRCPVSYDPDAKAPTWEQFLYQISNDDPDWVDFIQRAVGYSLSGHVNEEVMFFLLGIGANGKSVFCNVLRRLCGGYVGAVPANFLMVSKRDGESATPSLAALVGARIVQANEVEAGARLSAQMVKVATSTDAISARHLYGRQFTFTPTHTLWVRGNHKPIITDNDEGIWRRVVLIPFDRHFSAEEKDVGLEQKIMSEATGVLAWMVRGHLAYKQRGLHRARRVEAASRAYRAESDLVGQWIADQAICGAGFTWQQQNAYAEYRGWCTDQGLHPMTKKSLTVALKERGFTEGQETTGGRLRVYRGLKSAVSCVFDG